MMKFSRLVFCAMLCLLLANQAKASLIYFDALLSGNQEVPSVTTSAVGSGMFILDTVAMSLDYDISIIGLDLDGSQSQDVADDVTGIHFHSAPSGANGAMAFGVLNPNHDLDDRLIDPILGTITGTWDGVEGLTTLSDNIAQLMANSFYINVHTLASPAGEIRGQIIARQQIPEPNILWLLAFAVLLILPRARRMR